MGNVGEFGFGNGALAEKHWDAILSYLGEHRDIKRVLEIGTGYSTKLFLRRDLAVTSLDTDQRWLTAVEKSLSAVETLKSRLVLYSYPTFPALKQHFDMAFVDGPASSQTSEGRVHSMRFASEHCDRIWVHDSSRPAERAAIGEVFSAGDWQFPYDQGGLTLVERVVE